MRVYITDHAQQRWNEYCSEVAFSKLLHIVKKHLHAAMKSGLEKENGAFHVGINRKIKAVIKLEKGRWKVLTFYLREGWKEVLK